MNNYAFIVKDLKTYISAKEAWYTFLKNKEGSNLVIMIPYGDPNNMVPMFNELLDENEWEKIMWFYTLSNYRPHKLKSILKKYRILSNLSEIIEIILNKIDQIRINKFAKKLGEFEKIFSVHKNTHEHLAAKLNPKELYLLDSGKIMGKISNSGYIDYSDRYRKSKKRYKIFKFIGFEVFDRKQTKLFSIYKKNERIKHQIVCNKQDYLKDQFRKKDIGNYNLFISSPLYVIDGVNLDNYISYIESIIIKLKIDPHNMIYIPNPTKEKSSDIHKIKERIGCKIDNRKLPVEMKLITYNLLPSHCISPASTSLVNISSMTNKKVKCSILWHYEFIYFKSFSDWKHSVENNANLEISFIKIDKSKPLFNIMDNEKIDEKMYYKFKDWPKKKLTQIK